VTFRSAAVASSARPDLSVDGTIELERLKNVLYVGRPLWAGTQTVGMFKLARMDSSRTHNGQPGP
jgi:HlyD family secretion protein